MQAMLPIAAGDWWGILVPLVFFVIYALNRLLASARPAPPPVRRPQPRRPGVPVGQGPPRGGQPAAPSGQAQLNAEIEQFLRRAGERPRRVAKGPVPPPAPPREAPLDVEPAVPRDFDSIAKSVEQHLGGHTFATRVEHLADDIVRSDQQMERHVQRAFGRRVGTLGESAGAAAAAPVTDTAPEPSDEVKTPADAIARALANPQEIKRAIVLNEILQRPEHRW